MFIRRILPLLLLTATAVTAAAPAGQAADTPSYNYVGWSGGSIIRATNSTISSDLTAMSYVAGIATPRQATNNVAVIQVGDVVRTGAVETLERVEAFADGVKLTSFARTANVNLLKGLITADAVESVNVTTASPTNGMQTQANTTFLNLHIGSTDIPANVGKNFVVKIPGVVTVIANGQEIIEENGMIRSFAYGLKVILLDAAAGIGARSVIFLNPTFAGMAPPTPKDIPRLAGYAFGTRVHSSATSEVQIDSGRTANISIPPGGTGDRVISNSTAAVKFPKIIDTGVVFSTAKGLVLSNFAEMTTTDEITGVNLLNGLITADAIKVKAHATRVDNVFSGDVKMTFVNLVVAGHQIPVDVGKDTTIQIGDLATVVINKQDSSPQAVRITGIYIKLLKPVGDAPAGALVEISQALAWIPPVGH